MRDELAFLKAPLGMSVADQRVELGEMDAFGAQTYCASDGTAGQRALEPCGRRFVVNLIAPLCAGL